MVPQLLQLPIWALLGIIDGRAHVIMVKSDVTFNWNDSPEAYNNATTHTRINAYTSRAQEIHGPDLDPITENVDPEVVMTMGGGKKHGRLWMCDSSIDTASTPSLTEIQARNPRSAPPIHPRPSSTQTQMEALQVISALSIIYSLTILIHYHLYRFVL